MGVQSRCLHQPERGLRSPAVRVGKIKAGQPAGLVRMPGEILDHRHRAAAEGEFYHVDLIGLSAVDPQGKRIGEIVGVQNYGAGDLLEIRPAGSGRTELVPFTEATVPEVDVAAGRVVVAMPAATGDEEE